MRLALTHAYSWPDVRRGGERLLHELAWALGRRGHDVTVFSAGSRPGRTVENGTTTIRFRQRSSDPDEHERRFGAVLTAALAARRFDCVHSFGPYDAVASIRAARVRRRRTVYTDLGNPVREWWDAQPAAGVHDKVVRDIDVYGCLSDYGLEVLQRDYGRTGTRTPGGVDTGAFVPAPAREPHPTILFSGALNAPPKRVAQLVQALAIVARDEPCVRLWLSGPGDPAPLMASAPAEAKDRIVTLGLGAADAQAERYGRAWVTALPSVHEAFGLVLLESLACGTPVVASDGWG